MTLTRADCGHDPAKVYLDNKGWRRCRECERIGRAEGRRLAKLRKPLAVSRPRQAKRRADAKLNAKQIRAAWYAYQSGWSTYKLADLGWETWGFTSSSAARGALSRAFRLEGYELRSYKAARALQAVPELCKGCGCLTAERTKGCGTCHSRHWDRKQRQNPHLPHIPARSGCGSCGCPLDERTVGCETCRNRHSWRRCSLKEAA